MPAEISSYFREICGTNGQTDVARASSLARRVYDIKGVQSGALWPMPRGADRFFVREQIRRVIFLRRNCSYGDSFGRQSGH
jgi:hypothetical protein